MPERRQSQLSILPSRSSQRSKERHPEVAAHQAAAEELPFPDASFDTSLAQLVVHFMADPVRGLREMARVTRARGVVAASVWDHGGGHGPLSVYWDAVHELDPQAEDESQLAGATEGDLTELFEAAGLREIEEVALAVHVEHSSFDDWWEPYTFGVGPAGAYVAGLDDGAAREAPCALRGSAAGAAVPVSARAWAARARI